MTEYVASLARRPAALSRKRYAAVTLQTLFAAVAFMGAASCVSAPAAGPSVPLEIVQGEMIELWGVTAQRTVSGVKVVGNAMRRQGPNKPFNEHLHAEALDASGQVAEAQDVPWNSIASLRARRTATFSTTFDTPSVGDVSRVRVKVVPGAVHFTD